MTCTFLLMTSDGTPADPPSFTTITTLWRPGDTIRLGARTLRGVEVRVGDVDEDQALVVEEIHN